MGYQEDLADGLAGLALFSDLNTPELMTIVTTFEEVSFAEGDRVLRQGVTGAGFYVILDAL